MIPHNKPFLDEKDISSVEEVLKSGWLISGQEVEKLEERIKKLIKGKYALATNSGTSALHLSLLALNVSQNDEVIIPTYTCSALLNSVNYLKAKPVLVDTEKNGFNIDPVKVKNSINKKTKAIIVPHTFGFPAKIKEIKKFGVPVIEDCAIALGSSYKNKPLGNFGDISIFSFYATKMITSGQGGMITTNNKKYFSIVKDCLSDDKKSDYAVRYNYHLTDIAAALANTQLDKLNFFLKKRKEIAMKYNQVLRRKNNLQVYPRQNGVNLNNYRFIIKFVDKKTRDYIKNILKGKKIQTIVPIEKQQLLHRYLDLNKKNFENSEDNAQTTLSLPIYPSLQNKEVEYIANTLDQILE